MQKIFLKDEIKIWSSKPKRDFIFLEDAADAVIKLLNVDHNGVINLGSGEMNSIEKITNYVEKLSGKKIISENKKVSGPMKFIVDISLIKRLTGWRPAYSLEEGLEKTFNIMKEYYKI